MFVTEPGSVLVRAGESTRLECVVANMGARSQCRWQGDYKHDDMMI